MGRLSVAASLWGAVALLSGPLIASPFDKGGIVAVGARAAGQAGAIVARSDDASSLWWNPSGLDALPGFQVEAGYGSVLAGKSSDIFGAHRGIIPELGLGYGLGYRNLGSSGAFKLTEQTTALGLAFPFSEDGRLGIGAAVKLYQSQLDVPGGEARGFGLDLGARWRPAMLDDQLRVGVAVQDFQSGLEWAAGIRANPVQLFQGGLAWVYDRQTSLEIDYEYAADPQFAPRSSQGFKVGAERWFGLKSLELERIAALRLGYLQSNALLPTSLGGLFTLGLGLAYEGARLDYAYLQDVSALGETHRLSGSFSFGQGGAAPAPRRTPTPRKTPAPTPAPTATPEPTARPTEAPPAGRLLLSPEADIFAPLAQSARPQAVLAVGYAGNDIRRWTLSVRRAAGRPALRVLTGKGLPAKLAWDGKDSGGKTAADGSYLLQLSALTESGNSLAAEAKIDLDTRRPKLSLQAEPRLFDAKSDGGNVSILLGLESSTGIVAKWSLRVETLESTPVKVYSGKGTPPDRILWAGVQEDGAAVAKGSLYYLGYSVEMESGAVARLPRMSLASKLDEPTQPFRVPLQTLRFNEGDEAVNLEDYRALKEASAAVKKYSSTDYLLQVLGYCDRDEAASADPIELSMLRAKAVRDYLVDSEGLDPAKVRVMGYGVPAQAAEDRSDDGKAKSRRVEIILYAK